jgi:hypothetical protein
VFPRGNQIVRPSTFSTLTTTRPLPVLRPRTRARGCRELDTASAVADHRVEGAARRTGRHSEWSSGHPGLDMLHFRVHHVG